MLEIKDGKKILTTPVSAEDLKDIHAGDIIYLNGSMTTCRDVAHRRLVEEGRELPVDVKDAAIFHVAKRSHCQMERRCQSRILISLIMQDYSGRYTFWHCRENP